ncbi:hypothetical protein H4Q26_015260 [Puccinia striiformis f. sp. tritici PST-130]|nr:hypothetical protein H4Q26_015260 [Puccinia striiformis f. sp. tritici PST-130]
MSIIPNHIESWKQLEVDQFLSNFPEEKDTSLDDFTFGNHITNFVCGLGENCLAGQDPSGLRYTLCKSGIFMSTPCMMLPQQQLRRSRGSLPSFGPVLFPAWGVATEAELLEEEAPVADEMFQSTMHIHERRSLTKRSLPAADHLSPDAVNIRPPTKQGNATLFDKQSVWAELVVSVLSGDEKAFLRIKNNLVSAYEPTEDQRLLKRSAPQDIPRIILRHGTS